MNTTNLRVGVSIEQCRLLTALLTVENENYRRLLRLAWRQNSYMKRQDVDRLESNSRDWAQYLPSADQARITRERFVAELAQLAGISVPPGRVSDLLDYTDPSSKQQVIAVMGRLRDTAARLARQNELNRNLAEFCLDLAQEESKIFQKCVLKDPAGCYGGDAKATSRGPSGFLVKQA